MADVPVQKLTFTDDVGTEERRRMIAADVYARGVGGRADVTAAQITRGADVLVKFFRDGTIVPK